MEIAKTNKVKQELLIELENGTDECDKFMSMLVEFIEKESKQKIEGTIECLRVYKNYESSDVQIEIKTLKEDKLKLIATDVEAKVE